MQVVIIEDVIHSDAIKDSESPKIINVPNVQKIATNVMEMDAILHLAIKDTEMIWEDPENVKNVLKIVHTVTEENAEDALTVVQEQVTKNHALIVERIVLFVMLTETVADVFGDSTPRMVNVQLVLPIVYGAEMENVSGAVEDSEEIDQQEHVIKDKFRIL